MTETSESSVYAHFIGVGGAGMSGIARVMHDRGIRVSGSDLKESRYTRALRDADVQIFIGHDAAHLGDPSVVVVSSAIPETNPELAEALSRGVEVWPRARMLAHLSEGSSTIAVAGTHGKTSTSAMVATMLGAMDLDPTFVVGGEVAAYGTNARAGSGESYVVEADESDGSFMFLEPRVALLTNVEADHLDHYGSLERVEETFIEFMERVVLDGTLVLCADDARLLELASGVDRRRVTYGAAKDADVRYELLAPSGREGRFTVSFPDARKVEVRIGVPGEHMVQNATGALAIAWALGLDPVAAAEAIASYGGVRRRFDAVGSVAGVDIVDDYAHHPTEVRATLKAAKECGYRRVWVVFQPHRYSRTGALAREFGDAFRLADRVVLMDVYSAGEMPIPGVSGKTLVRALLDRAPRSRVTYLPHRADIPEYLKGELREGDLVMTMGAGDVTTVGPEIIRALESRMAGS